MASNPNNISGISIEDFELSGFTNSTEMDLKEMAAKIHALEEKLAKNEQQTSQIGGMQMSWQFGEKFGELKKEVEKFGQEKEELKKEMKEFAKKNAEMEEKVDEKERQMREMKDEIGKLRQENVKFNEALAKNGRAMVEMKNGVAQKDKEITRLKEENSEQKVQIVKLEDNNRAMQRKIERIETYFPKTKKVLINRRALSAELLNELFASLPMENAFDILTKMPNGLLARNMRKMLKSIEMAMRNNKWNEAQCGPKMEISGGGLVVKHSGPDLKFNCVRTHLAIPKFNLNFNKSTIAYFEKEILVKQIPNSGGISIRRQLSWKCAKFNWNLGER